MWSSTTAELESDSKEGYSLMSDKDTFEHNALHFQSSLDHSLTASDGNKDDDAKYTARPSNLGDLVTSKFYKKDHWFEEMCEVLFKISRRKTTIKAELYYGVIHFISCLYCLAVIPQQLKNAGYSGRKTVVTVAFCTGVGSIFSGLFANLPFVLAPPTVVSIFLSVFLQQENESRNAGNFAVVLSGALLTLFGWRPLGRFFARLIPISIQVGVAVGIGLLTALAGSTEIDLVEKGHYTILKMGEITPKICIAIGGVILVCITSFFHVKGSFCLAVMVCSLIWWIYDNDFPTAIVAKPAVDGASFDEGSRQHIALLTVDLIFLYLLYLNGLMTSLGNLAVLTREDSTVPRQRWIFIICGIFTIFAGLVSSAPILVSPESAASIKEGAKTGLSAVVAGVLFLIAMFFSPVFEQVPATGTSPVLIMIGIILFQNVSRIDWRNISSAAPAFIVLFYIPFTYSVIQGVILGYIVYICTTLFTGELRENILDMCSIYFPSWEPALHDLLYGYTFQNQNNNPEARAISTSHHNTASVQSVIDLNTVRNRRATVTALYDDTLPSDAPPPNLQASSVAFSYHIDSNPPVGNNTTSNNNTNTAPDFGTILRPSSINGSGANDPIPPSHADRRRSDDNYNSQA